MGYKLTWAYIGSQKVRPSWPELITTAGIYHSSDLWLISLSSDWTTWTTIADKNIWATTVYNYWDTKTASNYWWFFQRWNCNMFPFSWSVTTSSTQVDTTGYWPGNYYSSATYIKTNPRDSSGNHDLWGWTTGTVEARKWPCDTWFHIPDTTELWNLKTLLSALSVSDIYVWFQEYLMMPVGITRNYDGAVNTESYPTNYWACTDRNNSTGRVLSLQSDVLTSYNSKYYWYPIRPFYNTSVQPNSTWTVIYQPS